MSNAIKFSKQGEKVHIRLNIEEFVEAKSSNAVSSQFRQRVSDVLHSANALSEETVRFYRAKSMHASEINGFKDD